MVDVEMEKDTSVRTSSIHTLPNRLTLFRMLCVPVIVLLLFFPGKLCSFIAAALFGVASITDLLDGFLARRRQMVTSFGKLFDPLADKLIVSAALIMLIPLERVPAWMVVVVIGRELAITGLRGMASSGGQVIGADSLGKQKLIFQTVAVLGLLLHYEYFGINFHLVGMVFMWLAVGVTLWSGIAYFHKYWGLIDDGVFSPAAHGEQRGRGPGKEGIDTSPPANEVE